MRKGLPKNLAEIVEQRTHHVLGSDGDDIVVFGLSSSFHLLSSTRLIQGDGTFTCVVNPFTQLYILHGLLQNGVSYPLLYCLVRGKNQTMYERLLGLIEHLAKELGVTIFKRRVRLMVDLSAPFTTRLGSTNRGETSLVVFSLREQHQEEGKTRR